MNNVRTPEEKNSKGILKWQGNKENQKNRIEELELES